MMRKERTGPLSVWSIGWVVIIRLILYLVIIGFLLQYMYFGEKGQFYLPGRSIVELAAVFIASLAILYLGICSSYLNRLLALTFVLDLMVLSRVILASRGFNSVFIPFYLPILVMAAAWLPRSYTAIFPSMATLGVSYVGLAQILLALGETERFSFLYNESMLHVSLPFSPPHSIVSTMLILVVLFFVVSYLSGMLSDKLFVEQRLNAEVLSTMQEGLAVVDAKRRLMYANSEFYRIFPAAREAASFEPVAESIFHPATDGLTLERLLAEEMKDTIVLTHEAGEGGRPPVEIRVSGISLGKKGRNGIIILVSDLTERRRMEVAERSLERFSAISTMAAGLAHEIRNPLASLRSAIQEIGEAFPEGTQNRLLTDVVIAESDRLDGIIGRFLDFSREGRLHPTRTRLGPLLEDLRTFLLHDERTAGMTITVTVRDDPPLQCDVDRVKEVFLNLALNAIQAVPAEGGRLDITLGSLEKGFRQGVEVAFCDNGPGIDDEMAKHIFEPFFSSKKKGTGMGLALSRKQIGMHGGDIEQTNLPKGGACFHIWLPLRPGGGSSGTRVGIAGWKRHLPNQ